MDPGSGRDACVTRYRNLRPCWAKPIGAERLACVRGVLGLLPLAEERAACYRQGDDYDVCFANLRVSAYPYITFRFYDLEERAEGLLALGASKELVVPFVILAEQAKQDFNRASSTSARIAIIRRLQTSWRAFVAALPDEVKQKARTQGVGSSY